MRLVTLVENTCGREGCTAEHGLCIYAETPRHRLLLDAGQTDALIHNAEVLGVDLSAVDTLVLSHGHYDHAGGILPFAKVNSRARIYMRAGASEPHYNGEKYIGIDPEINSLPGLVLTEGSLRIDEELFLFGDISGRRCFPPGNRRLTKLSGGEKVPDNFTHEQCLVITEGTKRVLLSGCAHNGILNILDRFREIFGTPPEFCVTGFHLMKRDVEHTEAERELIRETARELSKLPTVFYSGHCTGLPAYELMKEIMGGQLLALHTGCVIDS